MELSSEGPMAIPLWINGHAFLTVAEGFFDVLDPASGNAIRRVPLCGAKEAAEAVAAARAAQPSWADMGMQARRVCLGRLADALESYAGHFAKLLTQEIAVDSSDAEREVAAAADALRTASVGETGVVAVVLDAGQPLQAFARVMAPALLAGATLIVKPSPKAPSAIFALCELSSRVDWPAGVVNLMQGDTAAIEGLCASGVDRLVYAGHPDLGAKVVALAAGCGVVCETVTV